MTQVARGRATKNKKIVSDLDTEGEDLTMFCSKCGKPVQDNDAFCRYCGAALGTVNNDKVGISNEITLFIDRKSQIYLINPPIKAVIDGSSFLNVENGKTEQIKLKKGPHTIELSSGIRSKKLTIEMQADTVLEIGFNRFSGALTAEVKKMG